MRRALFLLIAATAVAGCSTPKVDNPVMGEAPPRVGVSDARSRGHVFADSGNGPSDILQAGGSQSLNELSGNQVVALVNGKPILAHEVLDRYGRVMEQAQAQLQPKEFQKLRNEFLQRDMQAHIDRKILVDSLLATLKPEQVTMIEEQLDQHFQDEKATQLQAQFGVHTNHEVDIQLKKQGTSLEQLRKNFVTQQMAMEYLGAKAKVSQQLGRSDLVQYYQEHLDDYVIPAKTRFQQIQISYNRHGGKENALDVLNEVVEKLKQGVDFSRLAQEYSDGPHAEEGGQWDWTLKDSLADQQVEQAIFELPLTSEGQLLVGSRSIKIVKPTDRIDDSYVPFEEVQDAIRQKLKQTTRQEATQKVLDELLAAADVETIFDEQNSTPAEDETNAAPILPFE